MKDLSRSSELLTSLNFADDTTVFLSFPSSDALYDELNKEFCKVELHKVNRFSFYVDITCYIIINKKRLKKEGLKLPVK